MDHVRSPSKSCSPTSNEIPDGGHAQLQALVDSAPLWNVDRAERWRFDRFAQIFRGRRTIYVTSLQRDECVRRLRTLAADPSNREADRVLDGSVGHVEFEFQILATQSGTMVLSPRVTGSLHDVPNGTLLAMRSALPSVAWLLIAGAVVFGVLLAGTALLKDPVTDRNVLSVPISTLVGCGVAAFLWLIIGVAIWGVHSGRTPTPLPLIQQALEAVDVTRSVATMERT